MASSTQADEELVALICQGSQSAFSIIVKRHTNRFLKLATGVLYQGSDAEDAVQSAFIKLWRSPHNYRPAQAKFTTWFYQVVVNECRDLQRRHHSQHALANSFADQSQSNDLDSEELRLTQQDQEVRERAALAHAIHKLPRAQREALCLSIYSELSQRDIALAMQTTVKSVESHLVRARRALKETLNQTSRDMRTEVQTKTFSQASAIPYDKDGGIRG